MIDGERKLATIRRIADINPIPGADAIIRLTVDGWELVSAKDNGFQIGDLIVYFEIDSFLPVIPAFEFLQVDRPSG
jgi:RNA ligase (TIGR02306 family)